MTAYIKNDAFMKYLFSEKAVFQAIFLISNNSVPPVVILVGITEVAIRDLSANNTHLRYLKFGADICTSVAF